MSFTQALSGLNAQQEKLSSSGNNIANSQTVGYKRSDVLFADVFAGAQTGAGVRVADVRQSFEQGSIEATNRNLDLAIAGEGFYRLQQTSGQVGYSRNGQFSMTAEGNLVNAQGDRLMGYGLEDPENPFSNVQAGGAPQALNVPVTDMPANATTEVNAVFNLDARVEPNGPQVVQFSPDGTNDTYFSIEPAGSSEGRLLFPNGDALRYNVTTSKYLDSTAAPDPTDILTDVNIDNDGVVRRADNDASLQALTAGQQSEAATRIYINDNGTYYRIAADNSLEEMQNPSQFNPGFTQRTVEDASAKDQSVIRLASGRLASFTDSNNVLPNGVLAEISAGLREKEYSINRSGGLVNQEGEQIRYDGTELTEDPTIGNPVSLVNLDDINEPRVASASNFNSDDPSTYNFTNSSTVYDSLGNPRNLTMYFSRSDGDNKWALDVRLSGATSAEAPIDKFVGIVSFNQNGQLEVSNENDLTFDALAPQITFGNDIIDNDVTSEVKQLSFELDLAGTTQFANTSLQNELIQDGYTSGTLVGIQVLDDGTVLRNFSNEQSAEAGQIALATFRNEEGLQALGNNLWSATVASGIENLGTAGTGRFGQIESGAVEASNVDLPKELVDMIVSQRAYQANSTTISTQDELLQTIINL